MMVCSILLICRIARRFVNMMVCTVMRLVFMSCSVVVVCLPRPMERMGRHQFSDLFFTELSVPRHAAGVVSTLNCACFIYYQSYQCL